jgi:hypothetical protein
MTEYPKPEKPWRCKKYLAWIREKPCFNCGITVGVEAHHLRMGGDGIGQKPPDDRCIPLCGVKGNNCHGLAHLKGNLALEYDIAINYKNEWVKRNS